MSSGLSSSSAALWMIAVSAPMSMREGWRREELPITWVFVLQWNEVSVVTCVREGRSTAQSPRKHSLSNTAEVYFLSASLPINRVFSLGRSADEYSHVKTLLIRSVP